MYQHGCQLLHSETMWSNLDRDINHLQVRAELRRPIQIWGWRRDIEGLQISDQTFEIPPGHIIQLAIIFRTRPGQTGQVSKPVYHVGLVSEGIYAPDGNSTTPHLLVDLTAREKDVSMYWGCFRE